jgi:hypothetical protein
VDLVVVGAVTDERGDEVWTFDRLEAVSRDHPRNRGKAHEEKLDCPAKTCRCRSSVRLHSLRTFRGQWDVGAAHCGGGDAVLVREIRVCSLYSR